MKQAAGKQSKQPRLVCLFGLEFDLEISEEPAEMESCVKMPLPLNLLFVAGLAGFDWNEVACSDVCVCHGSIKAPPIHPSSRSPASASEYRSGAARTTSD